MRVLVGTSGYSYAEWKGTFYPEDLPASKMLRYYGERFPTVEANNTFYRMPSEKTLSGWVKHVPAEFVFAIKAPQRITHQLRLKDAGDSLDFLLRVTATLGAHRGPFLFQLPPFMKKNAALLSEFLALLPADAQAAFEFRHTSWFDDEIYAALRARNAALVMSESEKLTAPLHATADWGYLRLRREDYVERDLESWAERISAQPWQRAYVYLKHEESGMGPKLAARLTELLGA